MEKKSKIKGGLLVLLAGTCINLTLGVLYSWSVIKKALVHDWAWSNSAASMPYTVAIVVFAIALLVAGRMQDKMGPKKIVMAGVVLTGLGLIASSFFSSPMMLIITFGVISGTGIGFGYSCVTPAVMKWFHPSQKGTVTGIVVGGFGVASIYIAPTTTWLLNSFGISRTFFMLGLFILAVGLPMSLLINNPPAGYVPAEPAQKAGRPAVSKPVGRNFEWTEMVRTPQFYTLWVMFALASSAGLMIIGNIASIAKQQAAFENGFVFVALLAIFNAGGRIGGGIVSDKIGRIRTMQIVFVLQGVNMLLFASYNTFFLVALGTALGGIGYGALLSLFPSTVSDYYGMKNFGTNYGVLYTAWGIAGAIGPVIAGWVVDATGTYTLAYTISAALMALTLALTFVTKPVKAEEPAQAELA